MRGRGPWRALRESSADETLYLVEDGIDLRRHADRARAHGGAPGPLDPDRELPHEAVMHAGPPTRPRPEPGLVENELHTRPVGGGRADSADVGRDVVAERCGDKGARR